MQKYYKFSTETSALSLLFNIICEGFLFFSIVNKSHFAFSASTRAVFN